MPEGEIKETIPGHSMVTLLYKENGGLQRPLYLLAVSVWTPMSVSEIQEMITETLAEIDNVAAREEHIILHEVQPLDKSSDMGGFKSLQVLLKEQQPSLRLSLLAKASTTFRNKVNDVCARLLGAEEHGLYRFNYDGVFDKDPSEANDPDAPEAESTRYTVELTRLFSDVFVDVFSGATESLTDKERALVDGQLDGKRSYIIGAEGIEEDNAMLVPSIVTRILDLMIDKYHIDLATAAGMLIKFGPERLNEVIYRLRIGNNGTLGEDETLGDILNIETTSEGMFDININEQVYLQKLEDIRKKNNLNLKVIQTIGTLTDILARRGITLLPAQAEFAFNLGAGGVCPATVNDKPGNNSAYLPQVELALKCLELGLEHYEEDKDLEGEDYYDDDEDYDYDEI